MNIKTFLKDWGLFGILLVLLLVPGLRLTVAAWMQTAVLKTGLLKAQPTDTQVFLTNLDYQMTLEKASGELVQLQDWEDQVLFINFWATWCAPCLAEMPDINNLYGKAQSNPKIQFVMISTDEDWEKAKGLIQKKEYDFPIYRLRSAVPASLYSKSIPATFVVAPGGEIKLQRQGMASYDHSQFLDFLNSLTTPLKN